jgi:hypothetical protein
MGFFDDLFKGTRFGQRIDVSKRREEQSNRQSEQQDFAKHKSNLTAISDEQARFDYVQKNMPGLAEIVTKKEQLAANRQKQAEDPRVKGARLIGEVANAEANLGIREDVSPDILNYFDTLKSDLANEYSTRTLEDEQRGGPDPLKKGTGISPNLDAEPSAHEARNDDTSSFFSNIQQEIGGIKGSVKAAVDKGKSAARDLLTGGSGQSGEAPKDPQDFFQAGTEASPIENTPKTFQELGIQDAESQNFMNEMDDATEGQFRREYEQNPEAGQRIMELWKGGKINKKQLKELMSRAAIQQDARQSLGTA